MEEKNLSKVVCPIDFNFGNQVERDSKSCFKLNIVFDLFFTGLEGCKIFQMVCKCLHHLPASNQN